MQAREAGGRGTGQGSRGAGQGGRDVGCRFVRSRAVPTAHRCSVYMRTMGGKDVNGASASFFIKPTRTGELVRRGRKASAGGEQAFPPSPSQTPLPPRVSFALGSCRNPEAQSTLGKPGGSRPEPQAYRTASPPCLGVPAPPGSPARLRRGLPSPRPAQWSSGPPAPSGPPHGHQPRRLPLSGLRFLCGGARPSRRSSHWERRL